MWSGMTIQQRLVESARHLEFWRLLHMILANENS
jgi:hypothetical protein